MVVLLKARIGLVNGSAIELELFQQTGFYEFRQSPIDGGSADVVCRSFWGKFFQQLIRVEILGLGKYILQENSALLRVPHSTTLEKVMKTVGRCPLLGGRIDSITSHLK
jgi:hypothetical protein